MNCRRHVLISLDGPLPAFAIGTKYPQNLEIYEANIFTSKDVCLDIDLALLNNMETAMDLVFVGGGEAGKALAAEYKAHFVPALDMLDPSAAIWD